MAGGKFSPVCARPARESNGSRHSTAPDSPVRLAGAIKGFGFPRNEPESWLLPPGLKIPRPQLRSLAPHGVFAHAAMHEAIADAQLPPEAVSNVRTGMFCASEGSPWMLYHHYVKVLRDGPMRSRPFMVASGFAGTLNYNLAPHFRILGATGGFVSACALIGPCVRRGTRPDSSRAAGHRVRRGRGRLRPVQYSADG